jgi:prevent-host-death family protein
MAACSLGVPLSVAICHHLSSPLLYENGGYVVTLETTMVDMAAVGIRDLKTHASDIVERAEAGEAFLVTRRGKPVAVVLPFTVDAEDLILAHAPRFIRLREEGRADLRKGKTVGWETLKTKVRELSSDR